MDSRIHGYTSESWLCAGPPNRESRCGMSTQTPHGTCGYGVRREATPGLSAHRRRAVRLKPYTLGGKIMDENTRSDIMKQYTPGPWIVGGSLIQSSDPMHVPIALVLTRQSIEVHHLKQIVLGLLETFQQLADCDLHDENCSSLEVASRRIRGIARAAIAKAGTLYPRG